MLKEDKEVFDKSSQFKNYVGRFDETSLHPLETETFWDTQRLKNLNQHSFFINKFKHA